LNNVCLFVGTIGWLNDMLIVSHLVCHHHVQPPVWLAAWLDDVLIVEQPFDSYDVIVIRPLDSLKQHQLQTSP